MQIRILKGAGRHTLSCVRKDGTVTRAVTGPGMPGHDLAHYVAETTLGLKGGFFDLVEEGRSLAELSDPDVLRTLPRESLTAEVFARALGAATTGACRPDQFIPMVREELAPGRMPEGLTESVVADMVARVEALMARWAATGEGHVLELEYPVPPSAGSSTAD